MRTTLLLGLGGAVSLVGAACGDSDDDAEPAATTIGAATTLAPSTSGPEGAAAPLEGSTWTLAADSPLDVPLGDVVVTAVFDSRDPQRHERVQHLHHARTRFRVATLTVAPEITVTAMACPDPQMAVEDEYLERLPRAASYTIDGSTLTLADADGETLLVYGTTAGAEGILGHVERHQLLLRATP